MKTRTANCSVGQTIPSAISYGQELRLNEERSIIAKAEAALKFSNSCGRDIVVQSLAYNSDLRLSVG
ncbi:hypothetical protein R1flu_020170 [Riccia fluitans]|uniref:Uncharacterized protein n=1 Tax=Riccia fluitans TaxID=41844 RepID=A0ABD1ZLW9_9MARC